MTEKIIRIVFILYLFPNSMECTKLSGMLSDKRMNLNVLKMLDRFFYVRYNDAFFVRNTEKTITDEYLISLYTEEFGMTELLKKDLRMHAIYLENTAWYTTSITELFSILYTKYLAANHIISLVNCRIYYTHGDADKEKATKCKKITKYLHAFMEIALDKYLTRTEDFLSYALGVKNKNSQPYKSLFYVLRQYFTHVTAVMIREHDIPEIPDNKDGTPLKNFDSLMEKKEEEKLAFDSKKLINIRNETIKFWGIVDKLVKKIEKGDSLMISKETEKSIGEDDSSETYERIAINSNVADIIRKLEMRKLAIHGVKLTGLKKESNDEIFQLFIEPVYDGYKEVSQKLKFLSVEAERLSNLQIHSDDYKYTSEVLSPQDFSSEAQKTITSNGNYNSAADITFQSATNESFKTAVSSEASTVNKQTMEARLKKTAEIRRIIAEISSAGPVAERSSKMGYSKPGDFSHLAHYMASSNQAINSRMNSRKSIRSSEGNSSNYGDASQSLSRSGALRNHSKVYRNNVYKKNRVTFSSDQTVLA